MNQQVHQQKKESSLLVWGFGASNGEKWSSRLLHKEEGLVQRLRKPSIGFMGYRSLSLRLAGLVHGHPPIWYGGYPPHPAHGMGDHQTLGHVYIHI